MLMKQLILIAIGIVAMTGCRRGESDRVQGYVEGEYVYLACPSSGSLEKLVVSRGDQVKQGDLLFAIESTREGTARDEMRRRVAQAKANVEDARKGRRPTEIESIEAQLSQAKASLDLATKERQRQEDAARMGATAVQELDRARASFDQSSQRVAQLQADLATAKLGSREDMIAAAEENLRAMDAALARAEWELSEKQQSAPQAGIVFDTLYRPGEWVAAGKPVVTLLPPANVKVRAFVPQDRVGALKVGDAAQVSIDGRQGSISGKISFISPKVEFTPPVIYGQDSRGKLVFMIEIVFDEQTSATLHPGQPVDVRLGQ
jgi:HlyD family secretion protein